MTPEQRAVMEQALEALQTGTQQGAAIDDLLRVLEQPQEKYRYGTPLLDAMTGKAQEALDKMAENAREIGLEYEPAQKRPPNCGTGYCSCIECVMEPEQQEPVGHGGRPMTLRECMEAEEPSQAEPVAWVERDGELVWNDKAAAIGRNLYTRPQAREPEQQEPVAHFGSAYVNENGVHITTVLGPVAIPQDAKLYTRPPAREWVGLTAEERDNFWKADQMTSKEWDELFDAIETKLREKNT